MPPQAIAVDTQILMIAHEKAGEPLPCQSCYRTLKMLIESRKLLAVDKFTKQEYEEKLGETWRSWATFLAKTDRLHVVKYDEEESAKYPKLKKSTTHSLMKIKFSNDDKKFILLALSLTSKRLVAEEPHFTNVEVLLRKAERVRIIDTQAACDWVEANL